VGGLPKFSNQGTEACNHYHRKIVQVMGKGRLGGKDHPAVEVCLFLIRRLVYEMPSHVNSIKVFMNHYYSQWKDKTNKKKLTYTQLFRASLIT
jgi:hypothetical protein